MSVFSLIETKKGWFFNKYTVRDNKLGLITCFKGLKGAEKRLLEDPDLYMFIFLGFVEKYKVKLIWK